MSTRNIKICLVTSSGGHLWEVLTLKNWWRRYQRFWVSFDREDAKELLFSERVYYAHYPEHRNIFNFLRNLFLAVKILTKERPNLIFSTGAGIAPPFFFIGKILGAKLVFMETYDFIKHPTVSGRLVYPISNIFLVQHESQKKFYKKGKYWGRLF